VAGAEGAWWASGCAPPQDTDLVSVVAAVVVAVLLVGVAYLVDWPDGTRELVRWLLEVVR